jgi:CRISPR-associated protein Cmr6
VTIYVGNLSYQATEREIRSLFMNYGRVEACKLPLDRETGKFKGHAFVTLSSIEEEKVAIEALDGFSFFDRPLRVNSYTRKQVAQPIRKREQSIQVNRAVLVVTADLVDAQRSDHIPMEYRAQVSGRSQRQYTGKDKSDRDKPLDSQTFVDEWLSATNSRHPYNNDKVCNPDYSGSVDGRPDANALINHIQVEAAVGWRLITNSGIDDGFIRPVIGPGGWPLIPGSSVKGLFRRACLNEDDLERWCGVVSPDKETTPGILRFHGAWPKDANWKTTLLDVAHPQQNWQVGFNNGDDKHNAYAVISLLKPKLVIAISSSRGLPRDEWERIRITLFNALENGIGGRTAAGYGLPAISKELDHNSRKNVFLSLGLLGQGPASKLLDRTTEFRPTIFRGSIRSMALRLFGGLTDAERAEAAVKELFGGFGERQSILGLLTCDFLHDTDPSFNRRGDTDYCCCHGTLVWRLAASANDLPPERIRALHELLACLHALVMALGGFGPGWRRPDHSFFHKSYTTRHIGCHWQWAKPQDWANLIPADAQAVKDLIDSARRSAANWLGVPVECMDSSVAPWREIIHPSKMVVWSRKVSNRGGATAIKWTHQPTRQEIEQPAQGSMARNRRRPTDLRDTSLGGLCWVPNTNPHKQRAGHWAMKVGRCWIRMLPIPATGEDQELSYSSMEAFPSEGPYLEVLTCFPILAGENQPPSHRQFIQAMDNGGNCGFKRIWGEIKAIDEMPDP